MGWIKLTDEMKAYVQNKGWLRNQKTGRIFRANNSTIRRPELLRVSGPEADAKEITAGVTISDAGTAAVVPGEEVHVGGADADDALGEIMTRMENATKKSQLRDIGVDLGLNLSKALTNKVMREKIAAHVDKLKSFEL
jgi:endonuclease V-like protein UPF0215 family